MLNSSQDVDRLLEMIADHLDIPRSYYEKAAARHHSLGQWLQREGSTISHLDPDIRPQGSFRFGTVVRPLKDDQEYDLDNVCLLRLLNKGVLTLLWCPPEGDPASASSRHPEPF